MFGSEAAGLVGLGVDSDSPQPTARQTKTTSAARTPRDRLVRESERPGQGIAPWHRHEAVMSFGSFSSARTYLALPVFWLTNSTSTIDDERSVIGKVSPLLSVVTSTNFWWNLRILKLALMVRGPATSSGTSGA